MNDLKDLSDIMRSDWNRRVRHDYRFWMSDGYLSDSHMWETGKRDFHLLTDGISSLNQKSFLEVGCGVGRLLKEASQSCALVKGLDISSEAIQKASEFLAEYKNVELIASNGTDLSQISNESIDVVGVFASLSSAPAEVFVANILEINRVLKVGGFFRIQCYIGDEIINGREDTLHLRCYDQRRFEDAIKESGFSIDFINDLNLPDELLGNSSSIKAKICSFKKEHNANSSIIKVLSKLILSAEAVGKANDGEIEYWMTLNLAESAADAGDTSRAKEALQYALSMSKAVSIDVGDILERIVSKIENKKEETQSTLKVINESWLEKNLEILKDKFPLVSQQVIDSLPSYNKQSVTVKISQDGPVLYLNDTCLDHPEKPVASANQWVKRTFVEKRIQDCTEICVVGFGSGYHVQALIDEGSRKISVVEPDQNIFIQALHVRDLSKILSNIRLLSLGESVEKKMIHNDVELVIRPQTLLLSAQSLPKIKEQFYGVRGLKSLNPNIVVLGPLQGGTLPITGYTSRALLSLGQRTREIDMSPFNSGFMALQSMLKEPGRLQTMNTNYIECCAQSILESCLEKKTDILICMAQAPITGRVLMELRAKGIITVLWFMEDYLRFTYWKEMSKFYDFVFTIQKGECMELIKNAGAGEVHYLPMACDPLVHAPKQLSASEKQEWGSPISFVGAGYHNRQQIFASFAELPFKLWGTEWPGCKPFDKMIQKEGKRLTPEEYTKIFCGTDVNINLHSSNERDGVDPFGDFVNPRTFELAACGAFQLVDERSLLPEIFEAGKEVITFKDKKDLRDKIDYYLAHPEERKKIAETARTKVLNQHTYGHRLQEMLSIIYSSKYEHLRSRIDTNPWKKMLERTQNQPELHERCKRAFSRGEEAKLDGLIADIMVGEGKLSETEQKLLFLHHVSKQIIRMKMEEAGR